MAKTPLNKMLLPNYSPRFYHSTGGSESTKCLLVDESIENSNEYALRGKNKASTLRRGLKWIQGAYHTLRGESLQELSTVGASESDIVVALPSEHGITCGDCET
ncbi:uncharacterized protein PV09_09486 [Verruconis gallopava]|uniref:Uncharacterized protein n=1 Tax=Verruconis gallopava TaxID=253628 RepID=A0A0D2AIK4_9PEZI|nr:uncharacterized protein PV09_09486 [Verruconis gallopava]KIV98758.1 hypothetical protein PV09_09486 [Verruconis gallopava]